MLSFFPREETPTLGAHEFITVHCFPLAKYSTCYVPFSLHLPRGVSFAELQQRVCDTVIATMREGTFATSDYHYTTRVPTCSTDIRFFRFTPHKEEEEEDPEWMHDLNYLSQECSWLRERSVVESVMKRIGDGSDFDPFCGNEVTSASFVSCEEAFQRKPRFVDSGSDACFVYYEVVPHYTEDMNVYYVNLVKENSFQEQIFLMKDDCDCGTLVNEVGKLPGWNGLPLTCYSIDEGTFFDIQEESFTPSFAMKYQRYAQLCIAPRVEVTEGSVLCCCAVINEWQEKEGAAFSPHHIPRLLAVSVNESYSFLFERLRTLFELTGEECELVFLDSYTELCEERNQWIFVRKLGQTIAQNPVDEELVSEEEDEDSLHPPFFALYRKQYAVTQNSISDSLHLSSVCSVTPWGVLGCGNARDYALRRPVIGVLWVLN